MAKHIESKMVEPILNSSKGKNAISSTLVGKISPALGSHKSKTSDRKFSMGSQGSLSPPLSEETSSMRMPKEYRPPNLHVEVQDLPVSLWNPDVKYSQRLTRPKSPRPGRSPRSPRGGGGGGGPPAEWQRPMALAMIKKDESSRRRKFCIIAAVAFTVVVALCAIIIPTAVLLGKSEKSTDAKPAEANKTTVFDSTLISTSHGDVRTGTGTGTDTVKTSTTKPTTAANATMVTTSNSTSASSPTATSTTETPTPTPTTISPSTIGASDTTPITNGTLETVTTSNATETPSSSISRQQP